MKSQPSQKLLGMSHPPCSCSFCGYCWQDRQTALGSQRAQTQPCTGQSGFGLECCSQGDVLALCCTWGSLVPVARRLRTHLSAWRQISGCRCQQAACRCRAPGSHHSQRASGRAGTGCCGRSAAERRKVVAAVPVAARTSPVTAAPSLSSGKISSSPGSRAAAASLQGAGAQGSNCFQEQFITGFGWKHSKLASRATTHPSSASALLLWWHPPQLSGIWHSVTQHFVVKGRSTCVPPKHGLGLIKEQLVICGMLC